MSSGRPFWRQNAQRRSMMKSMPPCPPTFFAISETSVRNGSKPISIPDFTRGNWKNVQPWGVVNVDLKKMGLMPDKVAKDKAALNV